MTNSARRSGRPSSSAAYNVGDVVDTPDSAIKSWRYLGAGEWEPNDAVRYTTGPGGGIELVAGGQPITINPGAAPSAENRLVCVDALPFMAMSENSTYIFGRATDATMTRRPKAGGAGARKRVAQAPRLLLSHRC